MIEKISKYKHVIWDWNGTLINDVWLVVDIMNKMLKKRNLPKIDSKKYREIFDFPVIKYYIKLGFDFSKESFEELTVEFIGEYYARFNECKLFDEAEEVLELTVEFIGEYYARFNECKLFDEAEEVLKKIRDRGISQSILSASKEDVLTEKIKYYGIDKYFSRIIGLDNHYAESKIENGKKWIEELNLSPFKTYGVRLSANCQWTSKL